MQDRGRFVLGKRAVTEMFHFGILLLDPYALLWQVLAAVAIGGIVIVLIFAIIEPGPLTKKRPFPRKRRSAPADVDREDAEPRGGNE